MFQVAIVRNDLYKSDLHYEMYKFINLNESVENLKFSKSSLVGSIRK